jgi:nicotinamidase-related amidase
MTFPSFYDPARIGQLYVPNVGLAVDESYQAGHHRADEDKNRSILVLVDMQIDFIHADGALPVPGAIDDTRRLIEWLYKYTGSITAIAASLDSHVAIQIFLPSWWEDEHGDRPAPYTIISDDDVKSGRWKPVYEPEWSLSYVETLEKQAKKQLMIWPYHCMLGTPGHAITPALVEAIAYHSGARRTQPIYLTKGQIPKTEYYSMLEPEVKVPNHPMGELNTSFLNMLNRYDRIYIAGQAKSHCVLETITSIVRYFTGQMNIISKIRLLTDCMSPIPHTSVDFDAHTDAKFAEFAAEGIKMLKSTDPLR